MSKAAKCLLLALSGVTACSAPERDIRIVFDVDWDGVSIDCENDVSPVRPTLTDLRFYLHDVALVTGEGERVPVTPIADAAWQSDTVALIDLESGTGTCANGTPEQNRALKGRVPDRQYAGLEFTLGVPFDLNHDDPLRASPPLDDPAMHWHWRSGYKFLRAGLETAADGFWFHLGSTGCTGTTGDIRDCSAPNRVVVRLLPFDATRDQVALDLGRLFAGIDLDDGEPGDCSSGPAERACGDVLVALGLAGDRDGSDVFVARPMPGPVAQR